MKKYLIVFVLLISVSFSVAQIDARIEPQIATSQEEINKQIALNFYEDLWNSDNTDKYSEYVADTYIVH
ncbi:MAG: hypothetical protein HRU49_14395, partial [Winogradskyella sp.]|uniref:hypothetical protein n=1 Tax=Winogradskyella sp. TaxID=1883156 RepID=UPI0025EF1136